MFEEIDEIPGEGGLVGEKFLDSISGPSDLVVNNSVSSFCNCFQAET